MAGVSDGKWPRRGSHSFSRGTSRHTPFQFFVDEHMVEGGRVVLTGRALHKAQVQRLSPGEEFFACTSSRLYRARIEEVWSRGISARVMDEMPLEKEPFSTHLFAGLLKGDKFDLVVEKATELGVSSITPLLSARAVPKIDREKASQRKERWEKIALEASEQSHRFSIPLIFEPAPFEKVLGAFDPREKSLRLFLHEGMEEGVEKSLYAVLSRELSSELSHFGQSGPPGQPNQHSRPEQPQPGQLDETGRPDQAGRNRTLEPNKIYLFVGPEGGFDENEVLLARDKGFNLVSLGPRVLRAETASISALAFISLFYQGIFVKAF